MATNGNGGPAWVKSVATLGLGTVLALGWFYWSTQTLDQKLDAIRAGTAATQNLMEQHVDAFGRVNAEILFYLRAMCLQNAKATGQDSRDCVPPRQP